MTLLEIFTIVLIILGCVLIVFVLIALKKLIRSIDVLSADVHQLIDSSIPFVENLTKASEKIVNVADDAERHMAEFNELVVNTKEKFNSLGTRVKDGASHNPVVNLVKNLSALSKGISAFWDKYNT